MIRRIEPHSIWIKLIHWITCTIHIGTIWIVLLRQRVHARPHGHTSHVIPSGTEVIHIQVAHLIKFLTGKAERMSKTIGYLGGSLHTHFAAEGIIVDGLPDAVVAADHHPRTAEVVGDVVVPTGRSAVGIQVHIAAVELPQQGCALAHYQAVNVPVLDLLFVLYNS